MDEDWVACRVKWSDGEGRKTSAQHAAGVGLSQQQAQVLKHGA